MRVITTGRRRLATLALCVSLIPASAPPVVASPAPDVRMLVEVSTDRATPVGVAATRSRVAPAVRAVGGHVEHSFATLPMAIVSVPPDAIDALAARADIIDVIPEMWVRPTLDAALSRIGASPAPTFDGTTLTGAGTAVAIIDSGIDASHPFFARPGGGHRVVAEACFASPPSGLPSVCPGGASPAFGTGAAAPPLENGRPSAHGTHVAGIAAGGLSGTIPARGVAPAADLIVAQVFQQHPQYGFVASTFDIAAALDWVSSLRSEHAIAAVNLSLGFGSYSSACDDEPALQGIRAATADLAADGVVTVAAAGNTGSRGTMGAPACLSGIVSVGASTMTDRLESFSDISHQTELLAPGGFILSSLPGGTFGSKSGTSMAAPQAAGAVALLAQARPDTSTTQRRSALRASRLRISDARHGALVQEVPRLDVTTAVTVLGTVTAPDRPRSVAATAGDRRATVSWRRPVHDGGGSISGYTVVASPGGSVCTTNGSGRSCVVTGLTNGMAYTFQVRASNLVGTSAASASTISVTPYGAPARPPTATATHGDQRATVSWAAASGDGRAIDAYRITVQPNGSSLQVAGSARQATITGLANGSRYTFEVRAISGGLVGGARGTNLAIPKPPPPHHSFPDVPSGAYFDRPVRWLKAEGITDGVGSTGLYKPHDQVTRAQMAAFLWRSFDQPGGYPNHRFPDVPSGAYYSDAVRWLKAEGITDGVGTTGLYKPGDPVTRGQMAAFLWRSVGEPTGYPGHGFPDVPAGAYYSDAVRWLRAEGITDGVGSTGRYRPHDPVTRAQMSAFLHRLATRPSAWRASSAIPSTIAF